MRYDPDDELTRRRLDGLFPPEGPAVDQEAERKRECVRVALLAAAAMLVWLFVVAYFAWGAPAPLQRAHHAEPPAQLPERCVMRWSGLYDTHFHRDGRYEARSVRDPSLNYVGRWEMTPDRKLTIAEAREGSDFGPYAYEIQMNPCLRRGTFRGGGAFELEAK